MKMRSLLRRAALAATLSLCARAPAALAQESVETFYKGRTLGLIVGFNTGGAYDLYARVAARHMSNICRASPSSSSRTCRARAA